MKTLTPRGQIEELVEHFGEGIYIAGGAARAYMRDNGEPITDIDVFVASTQALADALVTLGRLGYTTRAHKGPNVRTLRSPNHLLPIDVVDAWMAPTLDALFAGFDLVCCQFGWSRATGWRCSLPAAADAEQRVIRINRSTPPVSVMQRVERYIAKGWRTDPDVWPTLAEAAKAAESLTPATAYAAIGSA